ncbi:sulfurtransferase [Halalkalibacter okhensis]|uniref:3-mercaptopyruvate sulfurtransferase n=1 Tax=Halalkalibacter okhensis TaxID=333138 RepID=A0A0B0IA66_9BACI|nr:sulfurtransferase [Halalkalibacter okhensis]KHF38180.1 3-mercaptopyruvate sulfurtransferase [Halalkalibacter okhensis]
MKDVVQATWLHSELEKNQANYIIVDTRFQLADPGAGKIAYEKGHLPGAFYVDLEQDLSSSIREHGGRHPLPNIGDLALKLGNIGISKDAKVVVYDDLTGMVASRFWWLLKHLGHEEVAVLNGGFSAWVKEGYELTTDIPKTEPKTFQVQLSDDFSFVKASDVFENLNNKDRILIDSRELNRFKGKEEPIDPIAGHIPGAINYFWKDVLMNDGTWKESEELLNHFSGLPKSKEIIVYCGSGISACPNVLALKKAGFSNVKLYSGSWSDWITHKDYPIETTD